MTIKKLTQATQEIANYRNDIIERLMKYAKTDMLLFWDSDKKLVEKQEKEWMPILTWARDEFDAQYKTTQTLDVNEDNIKIGAKFEAFLLSLNDRQLAAFYMAALNMRSVLLASALVKGKINAKQAYSAAYLEELFQADAWGVDDEAEAKRQERKQELADIEKFLRS